MMDINSVFEYVDRNRDALLKDLFALLKEKSVSARGEGMENCAAVLAGIMREKGIEARVCPTAGHPVVYGEYGPASAPQTLLVYGHYDVQPPEPLELWESDPFEPTLRGDRVYARGASDNKGQILTYVEGLHAYLKTLGEPGVRIKFLIEGEEEIASPSLEAFVRENREMLKSDICIFADGLIHADGTPTVELGLKGMLYVELTAREMKGDLHSMYAAAVNSPAWRLVDLLSTLKGADGRVTMDHFYDDVRPPTEDEIEAVKRLPFDMEGLRAEMGIEDVLEGRTGKDFNYNLIFEPTCNIAGLTAGYQGKGIKTVMPCEASAKLDMRLVPNQDPHKIFEYLEKHIEKHAKGKIEIRKLGALHTVRTPILDPFVPIVVSAVEQGWSKKPYISPNLAGSGPCYYFEHYLGAKCFLVPSGPADQNCHAPNENINLLGYFNGIRTAAALIANLSSQGGTE